MNSVNRRDFVKTGAAAATCDVSYEQQEFRHRRGRHPLVPADLACCMVYKWQMSVTPVKEEGCVLVSARYSPPGTVLVFR